MMRYMAHLEEESRKKIKQKEGKKRKQIEEVEIMKQKMKTLHDVCESLQTGAHKFAEQAEDKSGTRMAELVTKSNNTRRRMK